MNMHGFITPAQDAVLPKRTPWQRVVDWALSHKIFIAVVIVPTLLVAAYMFIFAADQYETEADFVIQSSQSTSSPMSFGDILGIGAPISPTQSQAMGVSAYLGSQQVANYLRQKLHLVDMYRRPEADPLTKLQPANPTPERLLAYYRGMVKTRFDRDTGISTLEVRAFRPQDSYNIADTLLRLGEQRVNELNQRSYDDAVHAAEAQVSSAESNARAIEAQMTNYRQNHRDIDPTHSGQAQTTLLTTMQGDLATARSQMAMMGAMISHSSPQYRAMQTRVASLQAEVSRQQAQLTGGTSTIAAKLGGYEDLTIRQEFAGKRYDAAAAALEKARDQAQRQSLYLLRIVDPVMPVKSLYPHRIQLVFTVFLSLLVAYGIGWLIVAGVREHAV